jgi:hypothetical protein
MITSADLRNSIDADNDSCRGQGLLLALWPRNVDRANVEMSSRTVGCDVLDNSGRQSSSQERRSSLAPRPMSCLAK